MWRFNQSAMLNLLTRRENARLNKTHVTMNPAVSPFISKLTLREDVFDKEYHRIETELQPFFKKQQSHVQKKRETTLEEAIKMALKQFLVKLDKSLSIQLINTMRDFIQQIPETVYQPICSQLEYVSKLLLRKVDSNKGDQLVLKQCLDLIAELQIKLYRFYSDKKNKSKTRECARNIMNINRKLTIKYGQINLPNQFYWMLRYALHSEGQGQLEIAKETLQKLYQRAKDHQKEQLIALRYFCRILIKEKNISVLKQYLEISKDNEPHYKIVLKSLTMLTSLQQIAKDQLLKQKQHQNIQRLNNTFKSTDQ